MKKEISISVRKLVELIRRGGDLNHSFTGRSRSVEGIRAHQKLQQSRGEDYQAEVHLSLRVEQEDYQIKIEGRADGLFRQGDRVVIEEIKSTGRKLEEMEPDLNHVHWAQAKVYAYIYLLQQELAGITVQLSYYQLDSGEVKSLRQDFSREELTAFFTELIDQYLVWAELSYSWGRQRDKSIRGLEFPFAQYRAGQRKLAVAVYKSIAAEKKLFIQAPTGIGKTISTLYPAIKAIGQGYAAKVCYLTARTTTSQVAEETVRLLQQNGLELKVLTLTARDRICFQEERDCNPLFCQYARGHFDRVNQAIKAILSEQNIMTRAMIEQYANRYRVCPFEFSLELFHWVDLVIGDYNYFFDPRVSLKRLEESSAEFIFLIDEAHNLLERAREMFSAELKQSIFLELTALLPGEQRLGRVLRIINRFFREAEEELTGQELIEKTAPQDLLPSLARFLVLSEECLLRTGPDSLYYQQLLEAYFAVLSFIRIAELYNQSYLTYFQRVEDGLLIKLFCLDPSGLLREILQGNRTAIFFSATLTPLEYFREVLGGQEEDYLLELDSPFSPDNLCLLIAGDISTRFREREKGLERIALYLAKLLEQKQGNYLVFFSSYRYMEQVYEHFSRLYPGVKTLLQSREMAEREKEGFLTAFSADAADSLLGFAVLGGIFAEGIDLKGERLSGVIIVGVGHPLICLERELIREYFQIKNGAGYEFAYLYPGMNKVLQAAGRTIRSISDRGVVLLIGQRFNTGRYRGMFPASWRHNRLIGSPEQLPIYLAPFWSVDHGNIVK